MNKIEVSFNKIVLFLPNARDWAIGKTLIGKTKEIVPGQYEYSLSFQNLQKIFTHFTGPDKPEITKGKSFVDEQRDKLIQYNNWRKKVMAIDAMERFPVEPNGKFIPYAHQTKIIGSLLAHPFCPVAADCFHPSTLVRSGEGYKPISEMREGDQIETLRGPASVEKTMSRDFDGPIIKLTTAMGFRPIKITPNHQFYVLRKAKCVIPSRGLNTVCSTQCNRSCPTEPRPHTEYKIQLVRAKDLTLQDSLLFRQPVELQGLSNEKEDFVAVVGYWLAEGWIGYQDDKPSRVHFGFNLNEEHTIVADLVERLKRLGHEAKLGYAKTKHNVITVDVKSTEFAQRLMHECGTLSHAKRIPSWAHRLDRERQLLLLKCMFEGDGHIRTRPAYPPGGRSSEFIRYVSVSYALASGVRDLLFGLGIRCSSITENGGVRKDGVRRRTAYRILISRRYMHLFGYPVQGIRSNLKQETHVEFGETYTLVSITKLEKVPYKGKVYNFTSSRHDSYLTDAGTSKNCGTGKTGSAGRAFELAIQQGLVHSGKILVSAPLSILHASWADDLKKFTHLRYKILWTTDTNKKIYAEWQDLHDMGEKPFGAIAVKTRRIMGVFNHITKKRQSKITKLDNAKEWTQYEFSFKEAQYLTGEKVPFGTLRGRKFSTEATKENFIRESLKDPNVDVFLINHDGVRIYEKILKEAAFEWVVIDESTKIKSIASQVTKSHIEISWKCQRRTILTGTPNPNGFTDLWSQYYFIDRGLTLQPSIKDFLYDYFTGEVIGVFGFGPEKKEAVKYVPKDAAHLASLVDHMRKSGIFLRQRDCIDLPPRTDMRRYITLAPDQEKAYLDMEDQLVAAFRDSSLKDVTVEAVNTLSKIMKLRQITSGFLTGNDGVISKFSSNPKLEDLDGWLEELGENKLVIACQFREEIEQVRKRYAAEGVGAVYGGINLSERVKYIADFQTQASPRIMALQPQAAAHGITLTAANYLLFLSLDYNFEFYYQTAKRIERIGQKNHIFVVHSLARLADGSPTIDEDLLEVLAGKSENREKLFNPSVDNAAVASELTRRIIDRVRNRK